MVTRALSSLLRPRPRFGLLALGVVWLLMAPACGDNDKQSGPSGSSGGGGTVYEGEPDRPRAGSVTVSEQSLVGAVEGNRLKLEFLLECGDQGSARGTLNVTLQSVDESERVATATVDYDLDANKQTVLPVELDLPAGVAAQADLAPWSVRIDDGTPNGLRITRSLLHVIPPYEVRLDGPRSIQQGKTASYRVQTRDAISLAPLADYPVAIEVQQEDEVITNLSDTSDDTGVATFDVQLDEAGSYTLVAKTQAQSMTAEASDQVEVAETASKVLLTTDKPIYQPGQTIHLRTLALTPPSNVPLANVPVLLEVEDGKGNKIMKRALTSDDYGIASTSLELGQVLNTGTFAVRATVSGKATEKSVEVYRYSLPKFKSDVSTDRAWYSPGDSLQGSLDAGYFFGKPVSDAEVVIEALTLDIGETLFARTQGRTDADGHFSFSVTLPSSLAGLPLDQGKALVTLRATVTDSAGQVVTQDELVSIAAAPVAVSLVPEGGQLIPGVENTLLLFASDPLGNPITGAAVEWTIQGEKQSLSTDAFGQARLEWTPPSDAATVAMTVAVTPDGGNQVTQSFNFNAQSGGEHVLVRTDRAVYQVGDAVEVEVTSSADSAFAYVDWLSEGQVVAMRTLEILDGEARFETPLDATLLGTNRVEAYIVDDQGNVVRSGRTFFVKGAASLDIQMSLDKDLYAPGDAAQLTFDVTDSEGKPAVAALGLQIVDEAIYSLIEARPGLLETHFQLEEAYSEPSYEIHPPTTDVGGVLLTPLSDDEEQASAQQTRAAAVLAALGSTSAAGVSTNSWPAVITEATSLLQPFMQRAKEQMTPTLAGAAADEVAKLQAQGCTPSQYYCDDAEYSTLLYDRVSVRLSASDFWGNEYTVAPGSGSTFLTLTSPGPDELTGSSDDLPISFSYEELELESPFGGVEGDNAGGNFALDGDFDEAVPAAADPGAEAPHGEEAGSSEPRVRKDFPETLYVNPAVITDSTGTATIEVPLADSITEWRVTALANSREGQLGSMAGGVTVFQDFFVDIDFPATLTRGDEVFFPIAVYNYLDTEQTVELELEPASWYSALGETTATLTLAPSQVTGIRFPVRVDAVGTGTLTVRATGSSRSDAVARTVRVVPDGTAVPTARSGSLAAGSLSLPVSFPESAVPGSEQLVLSVYPAYLSQVVEGMDSMLAEPYGCFEQTTSSTWPNVLVLDYMRATSQLTPEIQMRAESLISTGYQRLLTFEHPGGGFSWFGTSDPAPYLSVTAFGLMEFVDMARVSNVDEAMIARTLEWLVSQQASDGSWEGDQTEFFSFHTSKVRNTAFVLWSLATAEAPSSVLSSAISYVTQNLDLDAEDTYTLALVANALAVAAPNNALVTQILARLEAAKQVDGNKVFWDSSDTQTTFYSYGDDATVTATALVAHAMLLTGSYPSSSAGALEYLATSKNVSGNFGSTQATIWSLRALLLASQRGTEGAVGTLEVSVDGERFTSLELTEDQGDVMTTVELGGHATTGEHQVDLAFVGTGKISYNLVASHHEPWAAAPEPTGPLAVEISYDKTQLYINETASATVTLSNLTESTTNMVLVTLGIPPGFSVVTEDLQAYVDAGVISRFETTGKQLNLYLIALAPSAVQSLSYRVQATMPVKAADGGAAIYPYYEPDQRSTAPSTTLEVIEE